MRAGRILWLASYPKSGNTWVRALLTNYRSGDGGPASIDALEGGVLAGDRNSFDETCGVEASALDDATIERLRPDVYRCLAREVTDLTFVKVHDGWGRTDRDEPIFPDDVTAGVVYIVRNPLDLVASLASHRGITPDQAIDDICDVDLVLARSGHALSEQLPQKTGSWSGHVRSWVDESGLPLHLVRYEDLIRDTPAAFAAILAFCGLPVTAPRLAQAVTFSAFEELTRQERSGAFRERLPQAAGPFFRQGAVGQWREELDGAQVTRVVSAHADVMRRLGYVW